MTKLGHVIQSNIGAAKARLSEVVERAEQGEEVIIARAGRPAVRLVPVATTGRRRRGGWMRGRIWIAADFDDYDQEIARDFYTNG